MDFEKHRHFQNQPRASPKMATFSILRPSLNSAAILKLLKHILFKDGRLILAYKLLPSLLNFSNNVHFFPLQKTESFYLGTPFSFSYLRIYYFTNSFISIFLFFVFLSVLLSLIPVYILPLGS